MESAEMPPIWVWSRTSGSEADLGSILEKAGLRVRRLPPAGDTTADGADCCLAVVDADADSVPVALRICRKLRPAGEEFHFALLYIAADATGRRAGLAAGADACLTRPFEPDELLAQVCALSRIRAANQRLLGQAAEARHVNQRLHEAYQRFDMELELARRIQQSFLPQVLPDIPHTRFGVYYRPCGRVGGDFYDVFRLDEKHLGFYVADAMGHGLPGSLLTIYLKKGVRPKEISGKDYRLVPPDEVLRRLNHEMIEQRMLENSFITMAYALLNFQDGTVQFARAGHPLPVLLPAKGAPQPWESPGPILGVVESEFPVQTHTLRPGDKLLFFTDGIDAARFEGGAPGVPSLMAAAERRRALGVREFVDVVAADLSRGEELPDDFTLLALEWRKDEA